MMAVTRLLVAEHLSDRLDEVVSRTPAVSALGPKWPVSPEISAKARGVIQSRITRIVDAYAKTDELKQAFRSNLDRLFPGDESAALVPVLTGPSGPGLIQYDALGSFIVEAVPIGSTVKIPSPEWSQRVRSLQTKFTAGIGPEVPKVDGGKQPDVVAFTQTKPGQMLHQLWMSVISKGAVQIEGAVNLMLFDDRAAINRDIARITATIK